jgi:hypothetical protein
MISKDLLGDFAGAISGAATDAPDKYPDWSYWTFETHMADIKDLWGKIRLQLLADEEMTKFIDEKLQYMFSAFECGDNDGGRTAAWAIYNAINKLR